MASSDSLHTLSYTTFGHGKSIILLHGISSSHREWMVLSNALVLNGYQTFLPDLFGHGNSPKPGNIDMYTTLYQIQGTMQWINEISIKSQIDLIGHSFGGFLALQIASRFPEKVRKIVLIDPFCYFQQLSKVHSFIFSRPKLFIKLWQTFQHLLKIKAPAPLILNIPKDIDHYAIQFDKIAQQVLVVWGEKDKTLHPLSFNFLTKRLPNVIAQPLPRCGHVPHRSHTKYVDNLIIRFLISSQ
jgi:pimeloyl-ACP methyl ester carboxylesterase